MSESLGLKRPTQARRSGDGRSQTSSAVTSSVGCVGEGSGWRVCVGSRAGRRLVVADLALDLLAVHVVIAPRVH